jgi:hypothetical protein
VFGVEVAEVVVIEDIGQASFKKTEATVIAPPRRALSSRKIVHFGTGNNVDEALAPG